MKSMIFISIFIVTLFSFATAVPAMDFFVFPREGQSQDQQERDEFDCFRWARNQTGFDPMQTPAASAPPPAREARQGGLLRGGARGAAVGAVAGAIGGNAGRGAAIGAGTGALMGGMRRSDQNRRQAQAQNQWVDEQVAEYRRERDRWNRAFKTCMEGKGYTVN